VNLHPVAKSIVMIHRRDGFRAHQATVDQVQALAAAGKMQLRTFWELKDIAGSSRIERVTSSTQRRRKKRRWPLDCVIPQLGFVSSLGAIAEWGLEIEKGDIKVAQTMDTNIPASTPPAISPRIQEVEAHRDGLFGSLHRRESNRAFPEPGSQSHAGAFIQHGAVRTERRLIKNVGAQDAAPLLTAPAAPPPNRSVQSNLPAWYSWPLTWMEK